MPRIVVRFRNLRLAAGAERGKTLTIKEVSEDLGIHENLLGRIERGIVWPRKRLFERICGYYGVTDIQQVLVLEPDQPDQEGEEEDVSG